MNITVTPNTKFQGGYDVIQSVSVHVIGGILPLVTLAQIAREEVIGFTACEPGDFTLQADNTGKPEDILKLMKWHDHNKTTFTVTWKDA